MPKYGRINLNVVAISGDSAEDNDALPERELLNGVATIAPKLKSGHANISGLNGDGEVEIQLPQPVTCQIINGKLTRAGHEHVTLLVPETGWRWSISFDDLYVGDVPLVLESFTFPVEEETTSNLNNVNYSGTNIATYAARTFDVPPIGDAAVARVVELLGQTLASQQAAKTSETNAKTSETKAKTSETNAKASETKAKASEVDAAGSSASADSAKTDAEAARSNAQTQATNAANSATAANTAKTAAETARSQAQTYATNAGNSASASESSRVSSAQIRDDLALILNDSEAWAGFQSAIGQLDARIAAEVDKLKGGAPEAFDTLGEIAAELAANETARAALATSVAEAGKKAEWAQVSGKPAVFPSSWAEVSGKPASFPSTIPQVSGLQSALDNAGSNDAADLTGALTSAVDASNAIAGIPDAMPGASLGAVLSTIWSFLESFDEDKLDKSAIQVVSEFPSNPTAGVLYLKEE